MSQPEDDDDQTECSECGTTFDCVNSGHVCELDDWYVCDGCVCSRCNSGGDKKRRQHRDCDPAKKRNEP